MKRLLMSFLCILAFLFAGGQVHATEIERDTRAAVSIAYRSHVQDFGWETDWARDGATSGTTGLDKRLESIQIKLEGNYSGEIEYRTHVQDKGWESTWKSSGEISGSQGEAKRIEAIQIRLTGAIENEYDVYYRLHITNKGWLGWAKNGQEAGSAGWSYGVQAIEVQLVKKGNEAPGSTENAFVKDIWQMSTVQQGESTIANVKLENIDDIMAQNAATSLEIIASTKYQGAVKTQRKVEKNIEDISKDGFKFDFANYGKFSLIINYKRNGKIVVTQSRTVGLGASEYNIAPLSATFPVVYFSLSLWDIVTDSETGKTIPTIVMLDRPSAYNWESLPAGVYAMPYMSKQEISTSCNIWAFQQYVKDLYEINPNAKFNLYINDITCSYIQSLIYANRIPEEQCKITMLSDGSATFSLINDVYSSANPQATHDQMVAAWEKEKAEIYASGKVHGNWNYHKHWDYMYVVMCTEENAEWWTARNNLFTSGDNNVFAENIKNAVKKVNVNDLLQALVNKGDATVTAFKNLYDFNDGYFDEAQRKGKEAMVLLGTYVNNEEAFIDYANMTKLYYGDDYLYYYKGHPNTPTGMWPVKQNQLSQLGITDVDSSVAAELILFFNPDIKLSGYGSSTFNSASADMACGLFSMSKEEAANNGNVDYSGIDWFATKINKNSVDPAIANLCPDNESCYLMEFADATKHDIAIYNADKNLLRYYKKDTSGSYVLTEGSNTESEEDSRLLYKAHVAYSGWQQEAYEGETAGTVNQSKPIEAFALRTNGDLNGSIEYRAHVAYVGWQNWVKDGAVAGTTGQSKQIEAISVRLTGDMADKYDVYYRVHAQNIGWMDWTKNGVDAGTIGFGYRVEAMEVKLVEKNGAAPGKTDEPFRKSNITYRTHVQNVGWQGWKSENQVSGTSGRSLRLEGIQIKLTDPAYSGGIQYRTHVQNIGWQNWVSDGQMAGTSGQSLRLESIQIQLTGEMKEKYDVYYRVHVQDFGWQNWAKNGQSAGTEGKAKRLEAIEIKIVEK